MSLMNADGSFKELVEQREEELVRLIDVCDRALIALDGGSDTTFVGHDDEARIVVLAAEAIASRVSPQGDSDQNGAA